MLLSLAIIMVLGLLAGHLCSKLGLPSLLGMLIVGILLGPHVFNLIDQSVLNISTELRRIALVTILARAGLSLELEDLRKVGRPAVLMSFVPACAEILAIVFLATHILHLELVEAALLGAVLAAVSPAVVVPKMLQVIEDGYGTKQGIPQLILAAATVDDIFVIVLFTSFMDLARTNSFSPTSFLSIPLAIASGIIVGILCGIVLGKFFRRFKLGRTVRLILVISLFFALAGLEDLLVGQVPFSGLLAIMATGISLQKVASRQETEQLAESFAQIWIPAEVLLFSLVGASVNIAYAKAAGVGIIIVVFLALIGRMGGVFLSLLGTQLNFKERAFTMLAYTPKATVQAAIGSLPLAAGLAAGETILTAAVMSILLTAPLGAFMIELTYKKLLSKSDV